MWPLAKVDSSITGGSGADVIFGGAGKDVIVGGGGADYIDAGRGADSITLSGNTSTVKQFANSSGVNATLNTATSELTATFDVIKGAVAGTKLDLSTFARVHAEKLQSSLKRGALDDAALASLVVSLAGAPAAPAKHLAALHGALDDFDFPLAASTLEAILDSLSKE